MQLQEVKSISSGQPASHDVRGGPIYNLKPKSVAVVVDTARLLQVVPHHCNRAGVHRDRLGGVQIDGRLLITGTEVWIVGCPCCRAIGRRVSPGCTLTTAVLRSDVAL